MIITALLNLVYVVVYGFTLPLRLLSDVSLSSDFADALAVVGANISGIEAIFPIYSLLAALSFYALVEGGILTYKGIMWLIRRIPTQS